MQPSGGLTPELLQQLAMATQDPSMKKIIGQMAQRAKLQEVAGVDEQGMDMKPPGAPDAGLPPPPPGMDAGLGGFVQRLSQGPQPDMGGPRPGGPPPGPSAPPGAPPSGGGFPPPPAGMNPRLAKFVQALSTGPQPDMGAPPPGPLGPSMNDGDGDEGASYKVQPGDMGANIAKGLLPQGANQAQVMAMLKMLASMNQGDAFGTPGDWTTLKAGASLQLPNQFAPGANMDMGRMSGGVGGMPPPMPPPMPGMGPPGMPGFQLNEPGMQRGGPDLSLMLANSPNAAYTPPPPPELSTAFAGPPGSGMGKGKFKRKPFSPGA